MTFDKLGDLAAGVGRFGRAVGSFGFTEFQRSEAIQRALQEQKQQQDVGNVLSLGSIPAFARPGGAEPLSPEQLKQTQLLQLGALGTPAATDILTDISPLASKGVTAPASVREFQFRQKLSPAEQKTFDRVKRAVPDEFLARKGLVRDAVGNITPLAGLAQSLEEVAAAKQTGVEKVKTEFIPARAGKVITEKDRANRVANFPKVQASFEFASAKSSDVLSKIDSILPRISLATAGIGSLLGAVRGTPAFDLRADIDTILANVGFDELQNMRDNSPTGGALGAIAVREIELLQAVKDNLQAGQSPKQLRRNLESTRKKLQAVQKRKQKILQREAKFLDIDLSRTGEFIEPEVVPTGGSINTLSNEEILRLLNE